MSETKFNFEIGDKVSVKPATINHLSGKNLTLTGKERVDGRDMWKATDNHTTYLLFAEQIILTEEVRFKPGQTVRLTKDGLSRYPWAEGELTIKHIHIPPHGILWEKHAYHVEITKNRTTMFFEDELELIPEEEKKEMFKPYTLITMRTVKDSYGTSTPSIPEGWEAIDFRPAVTKERFLSNSGAVLEATHDQAKEVPSIILRKLEPISDKELLDCLIGWLWDTAPGTLTNSFLSYSKVFESREEFNKAILSRATELARKKKAKS